MATKQSDHGIAWTDRSWNPIRGCSRVSAGCQACYAEAIAARFSGPGQAYEGLARRRSNGEPQWTGEVRVIKKDMLAPLRWRKPQRIFVNSMSDLFHENVSDETIERVFAVMAVARQHTFQVLTKRPARMRALVNDVDFAVEVVKRLREIAWSRDHNADVRELTTWPLPNVWLGVSVENQAAADERIPLLAQTPAAVRFLSCEPLLGPIDFDEVGSQMRGIGWVIVGGESGQHARLCDIGSIDDIVAQCCFAGIACFVKQLGKWIAAPAEMDRSTCAHVNRWLFPDGSQWAPGIIGEHNYQRPPDAIAYSLRDSHGGDPDEWPERLRVRQFPGEALV